MTRYLVFLWNEDSARTRWEVSAKDRFSACVEAWRQFRELNEPDGEFPPDWTRAKAFKL